MQFTTGASLVLPLGKVVGGTTTINSGTALPTPNAVLTHWCRTLGLAQDFMPARFARYLEAVMRRLEVAPAQRAVLGEVTDVIARGAETLGLRHAPLPRNAPGCKGIGQCIFGCPEGAKRSADVAYIPAALRAGAQLFTGFEVREVRMYNARAVALEARGADERGAPRRLCVRAEHIVIACGALLSPLVLARSGIRLPWLGRNLSVHPALGQFARCSRSLRPWAAIPQGIGVELPADDAIRFEGYWVPPYMCAAALPFRATALSHWMEEFDRVAQYGFMVRDRGVGSVRIGPGGEPWIHYPIARETLHQIARGAALCAELLLAGGAREVATGLAPHPLVRTRTEARKLASLRLRPRDAVLLGAHPLGTCRMGHSAEDAVVDAEHRVFGTENLYVVDGAAVPTSLGVNPQVTIMAMALRAADAIASRCR